MRLRLRLRKKSKKIQQDRQKKNRESRKEDLRRAEENRSSVPGTNSREYPENTLSSSTGEVSGPSRFGGRLVGGTKTLEALSARKPGYGQDIKRIKEAYNVRESYPDSDYEADTKKRDYRNSIPRGYRDYLEKTMSQPPNKLPQTTKRSGGGPGRFSPSGRGVPISNASGQIIGDINGTFALDFQRRIGLKAIEMAGGQDKWNQLGEDEQRKLRLDATDKVTPYLDTLKDLWERGKEVWGKGGQEANRLLDKLWGKERPNPLLPRTSGLGQGLKPLADALKRRSPLDDWENPYKGKTPHQAEEEFFRRNPWTRPGYVPPLDPNYKPIEDAIPAAPPAPTKPSDPLAGKRPIKWRFTWTLGHSNKNARGFGEHEYFISVIPKPDVYVIDTGPQTTGYPGISRWWTLFANGIQIAANGSHEPNYAGNPESFTSLVSIPEPVEFEPIPDYQPVIVMPPSPPKLDPKPKPDPKPDPLIPREPQPDSKPKPKRPKQPFGPPQPKHPWSPPKPKLDPPTKPNKTPQKNPKPDPKPEPKPEPDKAPQPLPKPDPTPKPKPDPEPDRNHPPKLDPPRRPNKTTITTTKTTPLPPLIPLPINPSDPQPDPPIPDDEDPDMPCRYLPDLEQPVSLTKYDPLTKTMQPMPFSVHLGMAEALQFLATEIAELKRSNHQINNVTEAATLDTTGKIMVPQIQAEAVGAAIFAGPGLTSPVKTLSGQMNIWASLNHMMAGHHQLGRSDFPQDMMKPGGAKTKHTTALGFNHWCFNQMTNLVGMPAKHNIVDKDGVATSQNFKNQSDAIENIHAQNLGLEQDMSVVDKMLFKVLQELAQIKQMVAQNKYDIDVLIDESGAKTTQKIVQMPGTLTHGKDDSFFDKMMTIAKSHMVVREWNGDIDAKQLALKTNMEAQIAALSNKFEFDKTNPKLPILDRPKQNPKTKDDEAWKRYVNTVENPGPLRQSVGLPIPEIKEIKLGSTREIPKPTTDPDKLLGS